MKTRITLTLITMAFSAFLGFGMSATDNRNHVNMDNIRTTGVKTYPASTIQGRAWFVEAVTR